jgi:hypothetical protein
VFAEALIEELGRLDSCRFGEGEEAEIVRGELGAAALGLSVHGWVVHAPVEIRKCSNAPIRRCLVKQYLRGWGGLSYGAVEGSVPFRNSGGSEAGLLRWAGGGNDG